MKVSWAVRCDTATNSLVPSLHVVLPSFLKNSPILISGLFLFLTSAVCNTPARAERNPAHLESERDSNQSDAVKSIASDSSNANITLFLGGAFPTTKAPQGFNLAGASFGFKTSKRLVVGADVCFSGTSVELESGKDLDMLTTMAGILVSYYITPGVYVSVCPAYHLATFIDQPTAAAEEVIVAKRGFFKLGYGVGARLWGIMLELRLYPAFGDRELPDGSSVSTSVHQVRIGYNSDLDLFR
jgi:hypothetical protein